MARRPVFNFVLFPLALVAARLAAVVLYRFRCRGREILPAEGGAIILANHQSFFDPVLVGLSSNRPLRYLARASLFKSFLFGWLIRTYQAIPVKREGLGLDGLKQLLRCVKAGDMVLVFPEGTRTRDGEVAGFRPGVVALAKRAKVPVIPVAFDGPFDIWPRHRKAPRVRGVIQMQYGEPLLPEEMAELDDRALLEELHCRVQALHAQARALRAQRL